MASVQHSEACCTIPPVLGGKYENKGTFTTLDGLKTYKTGADTASTAIILIYDVFGFGPQIQQGADLLAHATTGSHQYQVYIPDFLVGDLADPSWFPPDSKEKQMSMGKYFGPNGPANTDIMLKKLLSFVEVLKEGNSGIKKFAAIGYCWGAKIVSLAAVEGTPFSVAAEVHPSGMTVDDAPKITIPTCVLASQQEDAETVKGFEEALTVPKYVEIYPQAPHGWMTSRGNLEDPKGKADYERGYATVLKFFHTHL